MVSLKNFKESDFYCPCCGKEIMNDRFLIQLQKARSIANVPFVINSGYRCKKHNKEVRGKPTSSHLKGLAVDIMVKNSWMRYKILESFISAEFKRIGIGKGFIHVDADTDKPQETIWLY